tara:strand:+ start:3266 stop:4591 length:1326 start_codon:yes stop_codon:yes gene_type:complete
MTTFGQNYDSYVNLYNNPKFISTVKTNLTGIISVYRDDSDAVSSLFSMVGLSFSNQNSSTALPKVMTPSPAIFFNFWNTESNINSTRELLEFYIVGPKENSGAVSNFQAVNNVVTYILSILFSFPQYNTSGNPTSFPVNLINTKNNQPAVVNIKNFLQSTVSSSANNILGSGNYEISETKGSNGNVEINTSSNLTPNSGFISILCSHQFDLYQGQNNKLTGEKLINSFRHVISQTDSLLGFCGCFAPVPPYFQNIKGFSNEPGGSTCDYLCYNNNSFKLYQNNIIKGNTALEGGGSQLQCTDNVCVIDNTSINSLNSNGNINFNQTCNGCKNPGTGCICYIDVSVKQLINKIASGKNGMMTQQHFKQNCSGNSVCFQYNEGEIKEVNCNEINTPLTGSVFSLFEDGITKITSPEYIPDFFWLIVMFIFFLLILFIYQILDY